MAHPDESKPAQGPEPASADNVLSELSKRASPFFALFGSAAAITAFLLFAGFLSDFAAYWIAGLPRLTFSVTALAESGVQVLIDTFSLLAGGLRVIVLPSVLAGVIYLWAYRDAAWLRRYARSQALYRGMRLLALLVALLLFAAMIDRAQRSISGEEFSAQTVESALREAYSDGFPTPLERHLAVERQGYNLRFYPIPNWMAATETRWNDVLTWWKRRNEGHSQSGRAEATQGIALRTLPRSRSESRSVFGWLALSLALLAPGIVLLSWWGRWLMVETSDNDPARSGEPVGSVAGDLASPAPAAPVEADTRWRRWRRLFLARITRVLRPLVSGDMGRPIERLVGPLSFTLAALSLGLLPLAHGLLARPSLGGENVMVYLAAPAASPKRSTRVTHTPRAVPGAVSGTSPAGPSREQSYEAPILYPEPTSNAWPDGRFDCENERLVDLDDALESVSLAARDFVQTRPTEESQARRAEAGYAAGVQGLTNLVIDSNCGEAIRWFWAARPALGLAAQAPKLAEIYRRSLQRVTTAYGVRLGTILAYPRDAQPLTLVNSIVPKHVLQGAQWSLQSIGHTAVAESVVLPDVVGRRMDGISDLLNVSPDHDVLSELLIAPRAAALEVALDLLEERRLHANGAGVAVTALGGMAWVSAAERPELTTRAIDHLSSLASREPSGFWPDKGLETRTAAATALHLARNPYAAWRFIEALRNDPDGQACNSHGDGGPTPLRCIETAPTAAGFLLQDLAIEFQYFTSGPVPAILLDARNSLMAYLMDVISRPDIRDDLRGSACTAMGLAGIRDFPPALRARMWDEIRTRDVAAYPFSSAICLGRISTMRLDGADQRATLRALARGEVGPDLSPVDARLIRRAALLTLGDLGVALEHDLLVELFVTLEDDQQGLLEIAAAFLEDATGPYASRLLIECATNHESAPGRRVRCLAGFEHLDRFVDGDAGEAAQIRQVAAAGDDDVRAAACAALQVFQERGGRWVDRHRHEDPVVTQCLDTGRPDADGDTSQDPSQEDIEALLRSLVSERDG